MLVASEDALFFQSPDVLEDGDLAGAELVGQLLHGRGIAMQMAIISDGYENVQLPRRQIHKLLLWWPGFLPRPARSIRLERAPPAPTVRSVPAVQPSPLTGLQFPAGREPRRRLEVPMVHWGLESDPLR